MTLKQHLSERQRNTVWLVAGVLLATALLFAANWEADRQEQVRMDAFRGDVADLARTSEAIIADRLREYDNILLVLRDSYTSDLKRFNQNVGMLRSGPLADREVLVVLNDREGNVIFTDAPNGKVGVNMSWSAYFRYFADGAKDSFHISAPIFGRVTGRHSIPMVRPIYDKQGGFNGVVALSVRQDALANIGPRLQLSGDTTITVITHDGAVAARSRDLAKMQGTKIAPELLAPMLKGEDGVFSSLTAPDGHKLVIAYRHIPGTPLVVYVESSSVEVLRETSMYRKILIVGAGFTSLVIIILIIVYLKGRKVTLQLIDTLRKSKEQEYETITQTSLDGFWIADSAGRILDTNDTFCKMLGYRREELLRLSMTDIEAIESPEQVAVHIRKVEEVGTDLFQSRYRCKDGSIRDVEISIQYVKEFGGRFFIFTRDITDRRRAEAALRESRELFMTMFEQAPLGIAMVDSHTGHFYEVNQKFAEICGRKRDEMAHIHWMSITHLDDVQEDLDNMALLNAGKIKGFDMRKRYIRPDGSIVWIHMTIAPIEWQSQIHQRHLAMIEDITEHKMLEEESIEMERKMLHSQKLESLGVLAGGIAHDFNNLLMTILGNMELAMDDISPVSPARPYLENAHTASKRAADLTRQMLAYSGKGKFVIENMNLSELVQENIRILRASIPATINLSIQLNSDIPPIMADAGQIQQVVMNLITNAAEAIGYSAGKITIATGVQSCDENDLRPSRLPQKPEPGEFAYLEVTDTGSGMDEETQAKIFDPFFTTKFTGRGLGMSAMQGIILGHKGAIFVKSEVGKGTTIRVNFPVSDSITETRTAITPTHEISKVYDAPSPLGAILIVDDEADVRQICSSMVERFGYQTLTAADGEEALAVFRDHADEIRCIILDMTMPKMDGYAAFEALRQLSPEVKVILSSGYSEQAITQRFTGLGLAGFIQKPYRRQQLQDELDRVIKGG